MRDNKGVVALEFALIAPPLLLLIFGILDLGRYVLTAESLRSLVGNVARAELIAVQPEGCHQPSSQLMAGVSFLHVEDVILCISRANSAGISTTTISGSYPFTSIIGVLTPTGGRITDDIAVTL